MGNKIAGLRQKRGLVSDSIAAVIDLAIAETRALTEEEQTKVTAGESELKSLDSTIAAAERSEAEQAKNVKAAEPTKVEPVPAEPLIKHEPGMAFARMVRSIAAAKSEGSGMRGAAEFCEKTLRDPVVAKALAAGTGTGGGFLVPENYSSELIELLRAMSVVRASGARTVPLQNGNLSIPKITGGGSATYIGENTNIATTEQTFGLVKLSAKKLAAITPISNDLIRFASPSADALVRSDLLDALALAEDQHFLRGDGLGAGPKGLRYWAPAANRLLVNGTVNLANVTNDTSRLMLQLLNANVRLRNPGWITSPRVKMFLEDIRDGNGNKAFPEVASGSFRGYPMRVTTTVPINLAVTNTSESELYFVDFADVVIGDAPTMEIEVSNVAAYHDGANVVSAYSLDQTVIRVIMHNDLVVRHAESVAVAIDVDWGV
jgi:HK97 family phage major capsid protein